MCTFGFGLFGDCGLRHNPDDRLIVFPPAWLSSSEPNDCLALRQDGPCRQFFGLAGTAALPVQRDHEDALLIGWICLLCAALALNGLGTWTLDLGGIAVVRSVSVSVSVRVPSTI
jgi:hypothetical protein